MLDLSVLHREATELSVQQALFWTLVWVGVASPSRSPSTGCTSIAGSVSSLGRASRPGGDAVVQYVTGYLLEWSLSVDNIFVIAVIFSF